MKSFKLLIFSLVFPLVFHAQKTLTGLWIGSLINDSTTARKDQSFELALTEYKGKVYGYSRSTFIVNDTLYYILKRVKGTIDGAVCEVKDDDIISYNFRGRIDKGIKVTTRFHRNLKDSVWRLAGDWKTNKTKKYYSISGKVELKEETDFSKSKILPHLEELNIDKEVEFYSASKKKEINYQDNKTETPKPVVPEQTMEEALASTTLKKSGTRANNLPAQNKSINNTASKPQIENKPGVSPALPEQTMEEALASTTLKKSNVPANNLPAQNKAIDNTVSKPEIKNQPGVSPALPKQTMEEALASTTLKKSGAPANSLPTQNKPINNELAKPEIKSQAPAIKINEPVAPTNNKIVDPASMTKPEAEKKIITNNPIQPALNISTGSALLAERKLAAPQVVEFKSDSLVIKLYDNGEIDGDTVSVLLNGEMLMAKQGLKASAIKKTIYVQPGQDEMTLVLYAENLGKYPPNTGLLVVDDGEETYQLRFSADLQQNAAVIFKRKK